MMEFRTTVGMEKPPFGISCSDKLMGMGSCFAENIGSLLEDNKFVADINPFGILYNPLSISAALFRLLHPEPYTPADLFEAEGVYHCFDHHSRFSSPDRQEALEQMNRRLASSSTHLQQATRLIITFGTAFAYRLKSSGRIVANCHKLPDRLFDRQLLTVDAIAGEWHRLLSALWEHNPELKVVFTVSPIRHWKDGAHPNQVSKATLLMSVNKLQESYPERLAYFPAYEIMMDELRDYRFYADDMLHPSALAIRYIWERFAGQFFPAETRSILNEWEEIKKAINHKPFQPASGAYKQFLLQTLLKAEQLQQKYPYFYLQNEIKQLRSKIE